MYFQYALHVYEMLMNAGKDYGIRNAGYLVIRHLRIEKMFAYWGIDMDPYTTPVETGREFRVVLVSRLTHHANMRRVLGKMGLMHVCKVSSQISLCSSHWPIRTTPYAFMVCFV